MSVTARHSEWLSLIEYTGPFLALPVLESVFPQGLEAVDTGVRRRLRSAYDEWREAIDEGDPQLDELHREWVRLVFEELLEYDRTVLEPRSELVRSLSYTSPEHGWTAEPNMAVITGSGDVRLLVSVYRPGTELDKPLGGAEGLASPLDRMTSLCRANSVRLGLVTNGERWTLVNAPDDSHGSSPSGHASWYARLWFQEPATLQAFVTLLGARRCFGPADETLDSLLERSLEFQEEITDTLGQQVRRAVEVLVQALDRADEDRNRELLRDVEPRGLYEAGLTVMMRLVFVLCAEERGLLLRDDSIYDNFYAVSPLRSQLAEDAGRLGPEILERRHDAWSRLLAVFRIIYGGMEYDTLRLPALGGSLFDPDRFPFLEGRAKGTNWMDTPAAPLPIDNRTVLMLLTALQVLEQSGGALSLSYKALDVEQIGHVYEGLLEYTVARVPKTTLGLIGSSKAKNPNVALAELESARLDGERTLLDRLNEVTGRSEPALRNALAKTPDDAVYDELLQVSGGDKALADRILPFAHLLRKDNWGDPLVYREGAFNVTLGTDRRETGTHYTPKSIAESVVQTTLEPLAYLGPAEGAEREDWCLKSSSELLDLKVCDPAMGSGAFLVQTCRWLAARLVEAWKREEAAGKCVTAEGEVLADIGDRDLLPADLDERLVLARRLVAERCLYGVDLNPLAVELAKLSLWLTTLAKGRPFGFLDHNLKVGDSLLGIHRLDQLLELSMTPGGTHQHHLFGQAVDHAVRKAVELRERLRAVPIRDIRDVQAMEKLDAEARAELELPELLADAFIGAVYAADSARVLDTRLSALAVEADRAVEGDEDTLRELTRRAKADLVNDSPNGRPRRTFHWPLEYPEVFQSENGGFDAFVGNPPFLGGQRITGVAGTAYRNWLVAHIAERRRGSADLVAYFFLRVYILLRDGGHFGLLAVNTIAEGDTRQVGLEPLLKSGASIHAAYPNEAWPGVAAVITSRVHVFKGEWQGEHNLRGRAVPYISAFLSGREEWSPKRLKQYEGIAFQGSIVLGMGFVLTEDDAKLMLDSDPKNTDVIFPYINGDDINSDPEQKPGRWVISFWDWPEEKAREYKLPFEWVKKNVFPERSTNNDRRAREKWWLFLRPRSELYHAIGRGYHFVNHPQEWNQLSEPLKKVLVSARVGKYFNPSIIENISVFHEKVVVFSRNDLSLLAFINSSIIQEWVWARSSRLGVSLNFSPSDAIETLPLPFLSKEIEDLGENYLSLRSELMRESELGLTQLYNCFHNQSNQDKQINQFRELQKSIDIASMKAYGWDDLDLRHDYRNVSYLPENDRVRFTISDTARFEVLSRLSELNRQRYEEEVAHDLSSREVQSRQIRRRRANNDSEPQADFFDGQREAVSGSQGHTYANTSTDEDALPRAAESQASYNAVRSDTNITNSNPGQAILEFLRENPGWYAKSDILTATGIRPGHWKAAIDDLLASGFVERQGERRGTRYRAVGSSGDRE